jgi:hypothetical protein
MAAFIACTLLLRAQHHRRLGLNVDGEIAERRRHPDHVTLVHIVVQQVRDVTAPSGAVSRFTEMQ